MKKSTVLLVISAIVGIFLCVAYIPSGTLSRMTQPCKHCSCTRHPTKQGAPQEVPESA